MRKKKNEVGECHLDVPMLDSRREGGGRVYCDLIMITNKLDMWEAVIREHFLSYHQDTNKIAGGERISLTCSETRLPYNTVNL